jgi:hypothetical protein
LISAVFSALIIDAGFPFHPVESVHSRVDQQQARPAHTSAHRPGGVDNRLYFGTGKISWKENSGSPSALNWNGLHKKSGKHICPCKNGIFAVIYILIIEYENKYI